jgi:hypothetical protein
MVPRVPDSDSLNRMAADLETLRADIQAYLDDSGLAVFHGYDQTIDTMAHISWDTQAHPNFREFLGAGQKAGVKLFVFHHEAFSLDRVDEALDQLEETDFTRDQKRSYETRLRQFQAYDGFTCSLELSFSLENRVYVYAMHTDWYENLTDMVAEIEATFHDEDDEDEGPIAGYFSKN